MSNITVISVFDNREITHLISQYLTPHDIVMTMATCKNLARQFEPILWKHPNLRCHLPSRKSILQNRCYIHTLEISILYSVDLLSLSINLLEPPAAQGFKMLPTTSTDTTSTSTSKTKAVHSYANPQKFVFTGMKRIFINDCPRPDLALPIINFCPNLTYLKMSTSVSRTLSFFQQLQVSLVNNLHHLEHLSLSNGKRVELETALPLLQTCLFHTKLQELEFTFLINHIKEEEDEFWISQQFSPLCKALEDSVIIGTFKSKITSLKLPKYHYGYTIPFLTTLLRDHLPDIERFTVPRIEEYDEDQVDLHKVFKGLCPNLEHLTCSYEDKEYDLYFLKVFVNESTRGIKTFRMHHIGKAPCGYVLSTLIGLHSETLEEIELGDCEWIKSEDLSSIFTSCENLRRFWITPGFDGKVGMGFHDIVAKDWICLGLRELHLILKLGFDYDFRTYLESTQLSDEIVYKVYSQIGRLVKLEKLALGYELDGRRDFVTDLKLNRGSLGAFAKLTELRHFHMVTDYWSKMGKTEVKFMHEKWPRLERITFGKKTKTRGAAIESRPQWSWLKEMRPNLIFDYA
ncbi:hypothetical protein BGZ49_002309 [Haplosporangium sp. Z 27]|nr:hypothetical protein BGZ49_002309 [Haplosporangium sp. Z 27]